MTNNLKARLRGYDNKNIFKRALDVERKFNKDIKGSFEWKNRKGEKIIYVKIKDLSPIAIGFYNSRIVYPVFLRYKNMSIDEKKEEHKDA